MERFGTEPLPATWNEMLRRYRDDGWEVTLLTFMFEHMPGGRLAVQHQQRAEVERIYRWVMTRIVRKPTSPSLVGRLPVWLSSPDYPVVKHCRQALRDVTINDGQHVHTLALTPPWSRLRTSLDAFVRDHEVGLLAHGRCRRVQAEPVVANDAYVYRYARKSEERGRIDADAFFVLPRTLGEVRDGPVRVGRQSSIFAAAPKERRG